MSLRAVSIVSSPETFCEARLKLPCAAVAAQRRDVVHERRRQVVEQAIGENGRFALINVWRNIAEEPVATHALALCDAQTVTPKDLAVAMGRGGLWPVPATLFRRLHDDGLPR